MAAILVKLTELGWIEVGGIHASGAYGLKWTAKGRERARWVKALDAELKLGPEGLAMLMVVCVTHAPE